MNIKSLLIGSAAAMAVSTGAASAADAIVYAEPEPVEYVRVCDVYGAGFFYIPGTETCLKIGGRARMQINIDALGYDTNNDDTHFMLNMDARSETEWGTLRGFGEVELHTDGTTFALTHAYIELMTGNGTLRIGRSDSPYARFLGYGASGFNHSGSYGFNRTQEISYTFAGGNGFSAIIALLDDGVGTWSTDVEAGVKFTQGWGSVGLIAGYDASAAGWGAKGVARFASPSGFDASLHVFYASNANQYNVSSVTYANVMTNWSILANVGFQAGAKAHIGAWAQWYDTGTWRFAANVGFTPVSGLLIRPEIVYSTGGGGIWAGLVRFERSW